MSAQTIERKDVTLVPQASSVATPMEMLASALEKGMPPEVIEKLMNLADRWEASHARKAFDAAVARAKSEIPPIIKNATGHNSKQYADFSAIAKAIDPVISRHGLAYRFRTVQADNKITVTCVLFGHGHSEETTLTGPADTTGNKNAIQAIGSTLTYLQRYSLVQALGLAASVDDDGKAAGAANVETITDEQVGELSKLLVDTKSNITLFLKAIKLESLTEIRADKFDAAIKLVKDTVAKRAAREAQS